MKSRHAPLFRYRPASDQTPRRGTLPSRSACPSIPCSPPPRGAGSTLIWAAELLGVETRELARLAATAPDSRGVYVVPAFGGLGASWWDASAVGTVSGFTFGVTRAPFARAALDSIAHQIADVLDAAQASGATGTGNLELTRPEFHNTGGGASVCAKRRRRKRNQQLGSR